MTNHEKLCSKGEEMSGKMASSVGQVYQQSLDQARLVDLREGRTVKLPTVTDPEIVIGLTLHDELAVEVMTANDSNIVIELCTLLRQMDGHWLKPNPDLPCLVDDTDVGIDALLSQGSTIKIGDRYLRYNYTMPDWQGTLPPIPGTVAESKPPPKPRRAVPEDLGTKTDYRICRDLKETDQNETQEAEILGSEWCMISSTTLDEELVQFMSSPEELANLAASNVCRQITMHTDLLLATAEIDYLFKVLQEVSHSCQSILLDFVTVYNEVSRSHHLQPGVTTRQVAKPVHGPVIRLLTDLLRMSLDPVDHVILWLKLLATLSRFTQNLGEFLACKTTAVVQGTMAAYLAVNLVQQYGCAILAQIASYKPMVAEKGPLRESGVELLVCAMKQHLGEPLVLRPACRALANLTCTYSSMTAELVALGSTTEEVEECVTRSVSILDMIEEKAFNVILNIMHCYAGDLSIQAEGCRLLAFFMEKDGSAMEGFSTYDAVEGGHTSVPHRRRCSNVSETSSGEDINVLEPFQRLDGSGDCVQKEFTVNSTAESESKADDKEEEHIYEEVEILQPFQHQTEPTVSDVRQSCKPNRVLDEPDPKDCGNHNAGCVDTGGGSREDHIHSAEPVLDMDDFGYTDIASVASSIQKSQDDYEEVAIDIGHNSSSEIEDTYETFDEKKCYGKSPHGGAVNGQDGQLTAVSKPCVPDETDCEKKELMLAKDDLYVSKEIIQLKKKEQKQLQEKSSKIDHANIDPLEADKGNEEIIGNKLSRIHLEEQPSKIDPGKDDWEGQIKSVDMKHEIPVFHLTLEKTDVLKEPHSARSTNFPEAKHDASNVEVEPIQKESRTRRWLNKLRRNKGSYTFNQQEHSLKDGSRLESETNVSTRGKSNSLEHNIRVGQEMALLKEGPSWLRRKLKIRRKHSYDVTPIPENYGQNSAYTKLDSNHEPAAEATSENIKTDMTLTGGSSSCQPVYNSELLGSKDAGYAEVEDLSLDNANSDDSNDYDYVATSDFRASIEKGKREGSGVYDYADVNLGLREVCQSLEVVRWEINDTYSTSPSKTEPPVHSDEDIQGLNSESELYETIEKSCVNSCEYVREGDKRTNCSTEIRSGETAGALKHVNHINMQEKESPEEIDVPSNFVEESLVLEEYDFEEGSRSTWGPIQAPDIQTLLANQSPGLTDSIEWATMVSSCHWADQDSLGEIDREAEREIRINRTKFKSVVAELKLRADLKEGETNSDSTYPIVNVTKEDLGGTCTIDDHNLSDVLNDGNVSVNPTYVTEDKILSSVDDLKPESENCDGCNVQEDNLAISHGSEVDFTTFCSQAQIQLSPSGISDQLKPETEEGKDKCPDTEPPAVDIDVDVPEELLQVVAGGHDAVCEKLAFRTVVLGTIMSMWQEDQSEAVILLNEPVRKLLEHASETSTTTPVDVHQPLMSADPALAINVFQALAEVPTARDSALKLLQYTAELMTRVQHSSLVEASAVCLRTLIEGPLTQSIKDGWGFFTFRRLHKTTASMLSGRHRELDSSSEQAIAALHNVLESLIVLR